MRSFASIATFATLAFASVASALPTLNLAGLPGVNVPRGAGGELIDNDILVGVQNTAVEIAKNLDVNVLNANAQQSTGGANTARDLVSDTLAKVTGGQQKEEEARGEPEHSVVKIIVDITAEIKPLCDQLTAAISGDVEIKVAVEVALRILGEIKDCLLKAKAEIEAAIAIGVDLLVLDGKTLAVHAVAQILAVLVIVVTTVLGLVVKVCAAAKVEILINLVVEISVILSAIIALVLKVCVGLLVELKPLVECIVAIIVKLDLKALINVLAIVKA